MSRFQWSWTAEKATFESGQTDHGIEPWGANEGKHDGRNPEIQEIAGAGFGWSFVLVADVCSTSPGVGNLTPGEEVARAPGATWET